PALRHARRDEIGKRVPGGGRLPHLRGLRPHAAQGRPRLRRRDRAGIRPARREPRDRRDLREVVPETSAFGRAAGPAHEPAPGRAVSSARPADRLNPCVEKNVKKPLYKSLYFQVVAAIVIGILLGYFYPETGAAMKPLGDGFIKLIKMIIAPIIFCTVVSGIAGMQSMKSVGKTGGYALLYFEIVSTISLIIGLVVVNVVQPGAGMNVDVSTLDASKIAAYVTAGQDQSVIGFILN